MMAKPPPLSLPPLLPISRATDLALDPVKSTLPRYRAYLRARHRFWDAFPDGGAFVRLPTPGTDLECGFHALRLSMRHQHSSGHTSTGEGRAEVRIPTLDELRLVYRTGAVARENEMAGLENGSWFTADQLAAVFAEWGRRFLNGGDSEGPEVKCQMGYVADDGMPIMMNTPWVETGEVSEGIVRVWVYNDGESLRGGVGHFEGVRRPTSKELAVEGRVADGNGGQKGTG